MKFNIKEYLAKLSTLKLNELTDGLKASLSEARDIAKAAEDGKRDFTTEERSDIAALLDGAKTIKERVKQVKGDAEMRAAIDTLGEGVAAGSAGAMRVAKLSMGQQFVSNEDWVRFLKSIAPNGQIADSRKGIQSPQVPMKGFGLFGKKDVVTGGSDTSAGAFVETDITGIYEPLGRYPLNLRDLVSVRQTGSDTVEFVRQTVQSNAAAPVPEANVATFTGYPGQVSGEKPESSIGFERVTENVKTIATWVPATKRALSDAAQIRGLIDQELREDLAEELENQMLNGNGSGENFTGLAQTANTLSQPFNTDIPVTTRKAITNLAVNGKSIPTGWLFNPQDWETVELLKDSAGDYIYGGPINRGPTTLWGVPVAQSFFQPQGTAWLGNWRKAVLWDREQAGITVSDSHADFFIRNLVAILAEMRAAFGVIRPSAFVEVDLGAS